LETFIDVDGEDLVQKVSQAGAFPSQRPAGDTGFEEVDDLKVEVTRKAHDIVLGSM